MRCATIVMMLGFLAACGAEPVDPQTDVAVAPPAVLPVLANSFEAYGAPGPWRKTDAMRETFNQESRTCVKRSNDARGRAAADDGQDAAYRAFLECMEELG